MKTKFIMVCLFWVTLLTCGSVHAQSEQQPLAIDDVSESNQPETGSNQTVTEVNGKILIQDTIRGNREQPRVLSIVPWQPPRDKASLPSPFVKRIEQDFMALDREEFTRKIQHFDRASGVSQKK